jgi:putative Holliday junction resolvase
VATPQTDPVLAAPLRLAAVDVGLRRVGVALSDPLRLFAQPVGTFAPGEALTVVARLHAEHGLEAVAVGWPLDEDGAEGAAVARIRPFLGRLRKLLPGVRVEVQDETGSSRRAMDALVRSGVKREGRREKGRLDAAAACVILEDYLREAGGS